MAPKIHPWQLLFVVILLDLVYFSLTYEIVYRRAIEATYGPHPFRWIPALLAWVCVAVGVWCVRDQPPAFRAVIGGSVFGVYNMTTASLSPHWPMATSLIDSCWGAIVFASAPVLTQFLFSRFRALKR